MGLRPGPIFKHKSSSSVYCNDPMGLKPKHSNYTPSFADVQSIETPIGETPVG